MTLKETIDKNVLYVIITYVSSIYLNNYIDKGRRFPNK